jgi:hypothetical protein
MTDRERQLEAAVEILLDENRTLRARVAELEQCVEDVAIGTKMPCARCGEYHPCMCDKGENGA